ncbi:hypothetical protein GCK32_005357 [Trichostrongylus colubriformis]|uniref:Peptidase metallopeptidase domain-containing protein n=1 Tax=Trichostrongylus colubriformis TaxID=6319 RepID=A0AAN8FFI3_TRICO
MLFYVLIAFIALNVFTREGVMAQSCQDMIPSLCSGSYKKYCNDDILGKNVRGWRSVSCRKIPNFVLCKFVLVGSHQCEYPFTSLVLAHAFRPRGVSFEPDEDPSHVIGDIHFNDDVPWTPALLHATAIHEIGHALGLPHVGDVNSVMYPILVEGQQFTRQDIYIIQSLYGTY